MLSTPSLPPRPSTWSPLLIVAFPSALLSSLLSGRTGLSTTTYDGPNSVRPFSNPCHRYCPNPSFSHRINVLRSSSTISLLRGILWPWLLPSDRRPPLLLHRPAHARHTSTARSLPIVRPPDHHLLPILPYPLVLPRPRTPLWLHQVSLTASEPRHSADAFYCFPFVYAAKIVASGAIDIFRELSKIAAPPDSSSTMSPSSPSSMPPPLHPSPPAQTPSPVATIRSPPPSRCLPMKLREAPCFGMGKKKRKEE